MSLIEMTKAEAKFIADLKAFSAEHYAERPHDWTTYEHETATLCVLLGTMPRSAHRDRLALEVARYVLELNEGTANAIGRLLAILAALHAERVTT